ncbi:L-lactate permease [Staphylococcus aureus]
MAANTAGGVAAKLISPQSIAIATAAVKKLSGRNFALLKMTLKYSIILFAYLCLDVYTNVNILNINNVVTWIQMTF